MAKISESLSSSIKNKVLNKTSDENSKVVRESNNLLKIIAKNTMSLAGFARDLNVARQNVIKLVKLEGGESTNKADAHFLKQSERETALEAQMEKSKEPTIIVDKSKEKSKGIFDKFKEQFAKNKILQSVLKFISIGAIVTVIFLSIKDSLIDWAKNLWEAIKSKFDEFTGKLKEWFSESVKSIVDKSKELIQKIIDSVSSFISSVGDWFKDKFSFIGDWFSETFSFVGKIVNKFKDMIEGVKESLREIYEKAPDFLKKYVPDFVVKFIGGKTEKEKEEESKKEELQKKALSNVVDDSREIKKLQRQQTQSEESEKEQAEIPKRLEERKQKTEERERVSALEKEKQYTGTDEVIRARLGLPSIAASQIDVGPEIAQPVTPLAPSPISAEPPTAIGKAAEPPGKQISGGSLASVASVQSGVDLSGLHPEFEKRLVTMASAFKEETGKKLLITSAYRSNEKQSELFKAKVAELGGNEAAASKLVARPMPPLGTGRGSFHLKGLAIDINSRGPSGINTLAGSRDSPTGWLEKFGLVRNVPNEDWHIQPLGTLPTADNPENPGAPTLVAGKDGKPMNLAESKKESMPEAKITATSGSVVSQASNDVAVGQRDQIKPKTPIIINAPTTNTNIVQNNKQILKQDCVNVAGVLTTRAA